jgi:phage-related baseplate assembly protein
MTTGLTAPPEFGLNLVPEIDFAVKDPTVIETEVISSYEAEFLELTGIAKVLAPGDPVRLFLLCVCQWLSHQRVIIDFTGKQNLLQYATGDYLDNLGALYGARGARLPASPALTTLRFTLLAPLAFDALVPAGTQCQAPTGVIFETLVDGLLPTGTLSVDVPAQAMIDGVLGNDFLVGQINSIINWNQAWSLQVENIDTSAGGADEETDDQYRYRLWLAIESFSTCGPAKAYEFWALSAHPSIAQCVVHSAPEIAGEVWLYPLLRDGQIPSPEIQALVLASCSDETRRPLTDYVSVFSPALFTYTLSMTYYVLQSNEVLLGSIQTAVNQAVADWILWQRSFVSRDLNCDELRKRCLEAGAKRVVIASPTPTFQVMAYNQLAVHNGAIAPVVTYGGLEEE